MRATQSLFPATDAMIKKLFAGALFAGLAAGLVATVLQISSLVPIILEAELYETGARVHFGTGTAVTPAATPDQTGSFLTGRNVLTFGSNLMTYVGYALLLVVGFGIAERFGHKITVRRGLLWGAAGFTVIAVIPGMGLPPELPGAAAAELSSRQIWWLGTVISAIAAIALIAFGSKPWQYIAALALLITPQLIGAPHPSQYAGVVPPEMAGLFASRSMAVNAAIWLILGSTAAWIWSRPDQSA